MKRVKLILVQNGLGTPDLGRFFGIASLVLVLTFLIALGLTKSTWIAGTLTLCLSAQAYELLKSRSENVRENQNADWPKFLDAIHSSAWAGASLPDAIIDSKNFAPIAFSAEIRNFELDIIGGLSFEECLDNLKTRLSSPTGDRFVEITRLAHSCGGRGYLAALRAQSSQLRVENSIWQEIRVKQNWVISTAKMAILAPWLVLLVLASRRETALAFETQTGIYVLGSGLVASVIAYKMTKVLGKLPTRKRTLL